MSKLVNTVTVTVTRGLILHTPLRLLTVTVTVTVGAYFTYKGLCYLYGYGRAVNKACYVRSISTSPDLFIKSENPAAPCRALPNYRICEECNYLLGCKDASAPGGMLTELSPGGRREAH